MNASSLSESLNIIHEQLLAGSRSASRDLFLTALRPLERYLASEMPSLAEDERHDVATDAVLTYLNDPSRCDTSRASLWTYFCMVAKADALDLARKKARRARLIEASGHDVELWGGGANDVSEAEDAIDARHIIQGHGHRLATNPAEERLLTLLLAGESATERLAEALGLAPGEPDAERLVKQAKDRMALRMRRLRDVL